MLTNAKSRQIDRKRAAGNGNAGTPELTEELRRLTADAEPRSVNRALQTADDAVKEATSTDIQRIKLIESGRCPECHARTENLLAVTVCPTCGWSRHTVTAGGTVVVHLTDNSTIACDRVYHAQGDRMLCVTNDTVTDELMAASVARIEYRWDDDTITKLRREAQRRQWGVCAWCDELMTEEPGAEGSKALETYVALGAVQEHYRFCSQQCFDSFRRQYPSRVHRNCYETECTNCDTCVKQFNAAGYRKDLQA